MINNLVKWVVISQHPFTIVEETYFINYIHSIHPTTEIPSANTTKSYIMKFFEENKQIIQNVLIDLSSKISFTTDCWTSPSSKSFMSITAHFIDNDWMLRHLLLDFIETYDHTGLGLKNAFISGLENFSIEKKVCFFIFI
jgi:hypothetical protein